MGPGAGAALLSPAASLWSLFISQAGLASHPEFRLNTSKYGRKRPALGLWKTGPGMTPVPMP